MIDIYHSRRGKFRLCTYWIRDERDAVGDMSAWILKNNPTGYFYASDNNYNNQANQVSNTFMLDKNTVVLETNDDVNDLTRGCIVEYSGKAWLVVNVSQEVHTKETEFSQEVHCTTLISITR